MHYGEMKMKKTNIFQKILITFAVSLMLFIAFAVFTQSTATPETRQYKVICDVTLKNPVLSNVIIDSYACHSEEASIFNIMSSAFSRVNSFGWVDKGNIKLTVSGKSSLKSYDISELETKKYELSVVVTGKGEKQAIIQVYDENGVIISDKYFTVNV